MKPFLKWAGGKRKLVGKLASFVPDQYGSYYEPFVGAGALFFHLQPDKAIINDSNKELMNVYSVVKNDPTDLINKLSEYHDKLDKECYVAIRATDPKNLGSIERAARFIYLNKTCFNGLFRVNSKGQFNVPYGNYKSPLLPTAANIMEASRLLEKTTILSMDYLSVCKMPVENDLVYFDPPYDPISKTSNFTAYTKDKFYESDQVALSNQFKLLTDRNVRCILSNNDTPLIRSLYADFNIIEVSSERNIAANKQNRGRVTELIISN